MRCLVLFGLVVVSFFALAAQNLATDAPLGKLEVVATFSGPVPTGVTVANDGRIFVNFPEWETRCNTPLPK